MCPHAAHAAKGVSPNDELVVSVWDRSDRFNACPHKILNTKKGECGIIHSDERRIDIIMTSFAIESNERIFDELLSVTPRNTFKVSAASRPS